MNFKKQSGNPHGLLGKIALKKMSKSHAHIFEYGLSFINIKQWHSILDIGCGSGVNIEYFLANYKDSKVYGIDISKTSVDASRSLNNDAIQSGRCEIKLENVLDLSLKDSCIDLATAICTLKFWSDFPVAFTNIYRVLRKGGIFLITDHGQYDVDMVEMDLYMSGFKKVEINKSEDGLFAIVAYK